MISTKEKINNILEEIEKISQREDIVVAFSGGLDSTVVSALAIQALRQGFKKYPRYQYGFRFEAKDCSGEKRTGKSFKKGPGL